jgi:hypothetical protein
MGRGGERENFKEPREEAQEEGTRKSQTIARS